MEQIPLDLYRTLQAALFAVGIVTGLWYLAIYRHGRGDSPVIRDALALVTAIYVWQMWSLLTRWLLGPAPLPPLWEQLLLLAGILLTDVALVRLLRRYVVSLRRGAELCSCCKGRGVCMPQEASRDRDRGATPEAAG